MSEEDQIKWVTLTLDFTAEQESWLEKKATDAGLSLKCYCVHMLFKGASVVEKEEWQLQATLRRNGCPAAL